MCLIMELVPGDNLHARIYRGQAGGRMSYIDTLQVGHVLPGTGGAELALCGKLSTGCARC